MDEKMEFEEFLEKELRLVEEKKYIRARDELLQWKDADVAEVIEEVMDEISLNAAIILFRMLPKDDSADVFAYLPTEDQLAIIDGITEREISYIIDELDFDDKIDVLEELPANVVDKILEKTPKSERRQINTFLNYPENCAGTLMTPDYISLKAKMTVRDALHHIKRVGMDSETVYTCYVKDEGRHLIGIIGLRKLVISDGSALIRDLMMTDIVSINVYEDQEDAYETFRKYGYMAIPVVDRENRLVGIITMDDILEVIEEETTEDIERMAGVVDDSTASYLDTSVLHHVKNRLPWLLALMLMYIITGAIIAGFETTLKEVICLTIYMPMLMGTGGNSGSQSATLIIRSMAVGDIDLQDGWRVLWKEIRVSVLLGIILSSVNFVRVMIEQHSDPRCFLIALTVCLSTIAVVVAAKCIGSMLPMLAKKIGVDPALMASPMISSLTDMVSVTTYFLLATMLLHI